MTDKTKLAEALNPSFVVELPPNTKSVKYNVPMAMMPLSDWEKIEAAIAPCEGEGFGSALSRLAAARDVIRNQEQSIQTIIDRLEGERKSEEGGGICAIGMAIGHNAALDLAKAIVKEVGGV